MISNIGFDNRGMSKFNWHQAGHEQLPVYENKVDLQRVFSALEGYPALIAAGTVEHLRSNLATHEEHPHLGFILQFGECAESFANCADAQFMAGFVEEAYALKSIFQKLLPARRIITVGRIAGQFAKPRSNLIEVSGEAGGFINAFRGEIVNSPQPTKQDRTYQPSRMLAAYQAVAEGLQHIRETEHAIKLKYKQDFQLFTSHEALLLPYEEALTKSWALGANSSDPDQKSYQGTKDLRFNLSAHMLWLGARTNNLNSPHMRYLASIENPVGVKVHPRTPPSEVCAVFKALNKRQQKGKLIAILRFGNHELNSLPEYLQAFKQEGLEPIFMVDPMHGNTKVVKGYKTRYLADIYSNIDFTAQQLHNIGGDLGGLHIEAMPLEITECVGEGVEAKDLPTNYLTTCDPRLNHKQTRQVIQFTAETLKRWSF